MADKKKITGSTKPGVPAQTKSAVPAQTKPAVPAQTKSGVPAQTKPGVPPKPTKSDRKREKIKEAFEKEEIRNFADIFDVYLSETPFARLIGMQKKQLAAKLKNLEKFNFKDITRISQAFDIDFDRVVRFIAALVKAQQSQTAARNKTK